MQKRDILATMGLERVQSDLDSLTADSIGIKTHSADVPVGASHLGGWPDLPETIEWRNRKVSRWASSLNSIWQTSIHSTIRSCSPLQAGFPSSTKPQVKLSPKPGSHFSFANKPPFVE